MGRSKPSSSSVSTNKKLDDAQITLTRMMDAELSSSSSSKVPQEFLCPLSKKVMVDPVVLSCGHTFEKQCVAEHLKHSGNCPINGQVLSHRLMAPNSSLRTLIRSWVRGKESMLRGVDLAESVAPATTHQVRGQAQDMSRQAQEEMLQLPAHEENRPPAHEEEEIPPPPPPPQANQGGWGAYWDMLERNKAILARQVHPVEDEGLPFTRLAANISARFTADGDRVP